MKGMVALAGMGLLVLLNGCASIPEGTRGTLHVGALQLHGKGVGLVQADTEQTTFQVRCRGCGHESGELIVETPSVGRPYTLAWVCPKCRRQQSLVIEASGL